MKSTRNIIINYYEQKHRLSWNVNFASYYFGHDYYNENHEMIDNFFYIHNRILRTINVVCLCPSNWL